MAVFELNIFAFDIDDAIVFEFLDIAVEDLAYGADQARDLFVREIMDEAELAPVSMLDVFGDQLQEACRCVIKGEVQCQLLDITKLLGDIGKEKFVEIRIVLHPAPDYFDGEEEDGDAVQCVYQAVVGFAVQECDDIMHVAVGEDLERLFSAILEIDLGDFDPAVEYKEKSAAHLFGCEEHLSF